MLSSELPDPIEKKLIKELANLEPGHIRILALSINQILNLIDAKGVDREFLKLHPSHNPRDEDS